MSFGWFCWDADHAGPTTIDRISWETTPASGEPEKSPIPAMKGIATMAKTKPQLAADTKQTLKPDAEPDKAVEQNPKPAESMSQAASEQLDEEEKEFHALRRDLPGVKGASAAGLSRSRSGAAWSAALLL